MHQSSSFENLGFTSFHYQDKWASHHLCTCDDSQTGLCRHEPGSPAFPEAFWCSQSHCLGNAESLLSPHSVLAGSSLCSGNSGKNKWDRMVAPKTSSNLFAIHLSIHPFTLSIKWVRLCLTSIRKEALESEKAESSYICLWIQNQHIQLNENMMDSQFCSLFNWRILIHRLVQRLQKT